MSTPTPTPSPTSPDPFARVTQGVYFDGRSSRDRVATLRVLRGAEDLAVLRVQEAGGAVSSEQQWPLRLLQFDPPLPGVRRVVKLPGGGRFETRDDAGVSAWERASGRNRALSGVRALESRWWAALAALGVSLAALALFVVFGIPALARQAAFATPRSVLATFDRETIELLENGEYFGPSKLSAARQAQLKARFRKVAAWAGAAATPTRTAAPRAAADRRAGNCRDMGSSGSAVRAWVTRGGCIW